MFSKSSVTLHPSCLPMPPYGGKGRNTFNSLFIHSPSALPVDKPGEIWYTEEKGDQ